MKEGVYGAYMYRLGLTDDYLKKVKSLCDVGSGANDFIAELKKKHPHIFAVGIEPMDHNYELADPHSFNHMAHQIGIPDSAPKFDVTVSLDAIPKYHNAVFVKGIKPDESMKEEYDYNLVDRYQSMNSSEVLKEAVDSISEMLRITKTGGKVILAEVVLSRPRAYDPQEFHNLPRHRLDDVILMELKARYKKYGFKIVVDQDETDHAQSHGEPIYICRLEITKKIS